MLQTAHSAFVHTPDFENALRHLQPQGTGLPAEMVGVFGDRLATSLHKRLGEEINPEEFAHRCHVEMVLMRAEQSRPGGCPGDAMSLLDASPQLAALMFPDDGEFSREVEGVFADIRHERARRAQHVLL